MPPETLDLTPDQLDQLDKVARAHHITSQQALDTAVALLYHALTSPCNEGARRGQEKAPHPPAGPSRVSELLRRIVTRPKP